MIPVLELTYITLAPLETGVTKYRLVIPCTGVVWSWGLGFGEGSRLTNGCVTTSRRPTQAFRAAPMNNMPPS